MDVKIIYTENLSASKVGKHIPSMSSESPFKNIENKHEVYIMYAVETRNCRKKFCEYLREHTMSIINFKKKKIKLLTKEQLESYKNGKICYICKEKFKNNYVISFSLYREI